MNSARQMLFLWGGAALLTATFAIVPPPAMSCGDKDSCACGAACPSMGEAAVPGACACGHDEAAKAAAAGDDSAKAADSAGGCPHAAAAAAAAEKTGGTPAGGLRAAIDPVTGELIVPEKGQAAAGAAATASASAASAPAVEIPHPGGGVMAAVPADRTSHAVAKIDENGKAQTGCAE